MVKCTGVVGVCLLIAGLGTTEVSAAPVTVSFSGSLAFVREFSGNVLLPVAQQEFASSFQVGQAIAGSITYDTTQPDLDPSGFGKYLGADVAVQVPQVGLSIARNSSATELRVIDNPPNSDDQFNAFPTGIDAFSNSVGLATPGSFWIVLFGPSSMLSGDQLPAGQIAWNFGNLSMNFTANDGSQRQVLLGFDRRAPIPEPTAIVLLGLAAFSVISRRTR